MIRLQSFDAENLIPLLSGIVSQETTEETYLLVNTILKLMPPDESIQQSYLIITTLEQFYKIYSRTDLTPTINKENILTTIENNIYEELKDNYAAGFKQYASQVCHVDLSLLNDEIIGEVANSLLQSVENILDEAIELNLSVNQSASEIYNFQTNYKFALVREAGQLLTLLSNSDMMQVRTKFWGWSFFLRKFRIYTMKDTVSLLNLVADFTRVKDDWVQNSESALSTMEQLLQLEENYIEDLTPMMVTPFDVLNEYIKFYRSKITVHVATKGVGKTTWGGFIASFALNQGLRVMFYSPETSKEEMINEIILPAYIRAKHGFLVTARQVLGLDPPYPSGSSYSQEEKKVIIQLSKQELVKEGNFMHVSNYYFYDRMESDMRAQVKAFKPDLIIFDHSQEVRGQATPMEKTGRVATTLKSIAQDYKPHCWLLSHPGSDFAKAIPTLENPITRDVKIAAYNNDVETLADNILGTIRGGDDQFKIFYTKLRKISIPPMFQVFRMNKLHGWFDYLPEDQYKASSPTEDAIQAVMSGRTILMDLEEERDEDEFDL